MLEAFFTVFGLVAIAEIGDKTQLLSLLLAAKFRRPWPIMAGILVATVANHAVAAWAGVWLDGLVEPKYLRWALGASFIAMAIWTLKPDTLEDDDAPVKMSRFGAFMGTLVAFFLAEIGDKTQVATTALAARYGEVLIVTAASTLGLFAVNAPVVFLGEKLMRRLPLDLVRKVAAAAFAIVGIITFIGW
ncbi:TMEM165/GDT1 family protein [Ferrovibrio sp.]|uniref:TMEM165/GDT1 family protein n=1 Tax=Ferrovibrio sp. TaxID=1917215 RepID=UPI003D14B059